MAEEKQVLNGMTSAEHDKVKHIDHYLSAVFDICTGKTGGLIVDVCSGGGGHIVKFADHIRGNGKFAAIDYDPGRIEDMLNRGNFALVQSRAELEAAFSNAKIAAIRGTLSGQPYGASDISLNGRADVVHCNAGIMFIKPPQLEAALKQLIAMLAVDGELVLRFSRERDDVVKSGKLGVSYFIHDPDLVQETLQREGLKVARYADLPDPDERGFSWTDIRATKPRALA